MLKIQTKTTKRVRIILIVLFLFQIFQITQPFMWSEEDMILQAMGKNNSIAYGDNVELTVKSVVDGKEYKDGSFSGKYHFDNGFYFDAFAEKVKGHNMGDEFSFKTDYPKDYSDKAVAGKTAEFTVKINNLNKKLVFTAMDFISLIGATDAKTGEVNRDLTTIGFCFLCFLILPIIAVGFQLFDFYYNIKNVVGFICSLLGVMAVIAFVGNFIYYGAVVTLIVYLITSFLSIFGMIARYQKGAENLVKKKKEYKPDDIV